MIFFCFLCLWLMMKILFWFSANFFSKVVVGGDEKNPKYEDWSILFRILVKFLKQNPKWVNSRTATKKSLKVIWSLQQQWNQHYHRQMQNHPSNVMIKNKNSIIHFFTFNFPSTLRVHVLPQKNIKKIINNKIKTDVCCTPNDDDYHHPK